VANVFTVQQSLYQKGTQLYLSLAGCESVENYYQQRCGQGSNSGSNSSSLSPTLMNDLGGQFPGLTSEEIASLAKENLDNPAAFIGQYQQNLTGAVEKYGGTISEEVIKEVTQNFLGNSDEGLRLIDNYKKTFPNLSESLIKDFTQNYLGEAGQYLTTYQNMLSQFSDFSSWEIRNMVEKHGGEAAVYLSQLRDLKATFPDVDTQVLEKYGEKFSGGASELVQEYQGIITNDLYKSIPRQYVQDFVANYAGDGEAITQRYLDLTTSSIYSGIPTDVISGLLSKNPNFDESLLNFYQEIQHRYGTGGVPDELVIDLLTEFEGGAISQAQVYKDLVKKHADLPEWTIVEVMRGDGLVDSTGAVDRYAGTVRSMVSSYQSYINSGLITVGEIQRVIIKKPDDYINILNQRIQRILPESEWNLIMY
jgi:hypothetical protein